MARHPFIVTRSGTALVVIDVQEKFRPALPDFEEVVENITRLILTFQMFDMPILVTEQYPQGLGNTVDIIRKQFHFLEIIEKMDFSCCGASEFLDQLHTKEINTVVVCGVEAHVCVSQTVLDLINLDFKVHVVSDAICSRKKSDYEIALRKMESAGVIVDSTEMVLFELSEKAGTESFKHVSRLVKGKLKNRAVPIQQNAQSKPVVDLPKQTIEQVRPTSEPVVSIETPTVDTVALQESTLEKQDNEAIAPVGQNESEKVDPLQGLENEIAPGITPDDIDIDMSDIEAILGDDKRDNN